MKCHRRPNDRGAHTLLHMDEFHVADVDNMQGHEDCVTGR